MKISNFDAATREVKETIGRTVYKELERYLCARSLHWWGENKGQDISKLMLLATCLHDARAYSYAAISDILKPKLVMSPPLRCPPRPPPVARRLW